MSYFQCHNNTYNLGRCKQELDLSNPKFVDSNLLGFVNLMETIKIN